jgi:hypothetical protein
VGVKKEKEKKRQEPAEYFPFDSIRKGRVYT